MLAYILIYLSLLLITLTSYTMRFSKKPQYVKMVILLMIVWLIAASITTYLWAHRKNNLVVFHALIPVEYFILALLYRSVISNLHIKRIIGISIPVFVSIAIIFAIFVEQIDVNNSKVVIIQSVIIIFLSLFYLREILLLQQITSLQHFPMFWISTAILFYFAGQIVIEGMLNYTIKHNINLARRIYSLEIVFKYLSFILLIIGAFCNKTLHEKQ